LSVHSHTYLNNSHAYLNNSHAYLNKVTRQLNEVAARLVFSFDPRCHGLGGLQEYASIAPTHDDL
jgi:hypothetical protein